jgi:hypothetical protein
LTKKVEKILIYKDWVYKIEREREREDLRNKWERWCERKRKEKSRSIKKKRTYAKGRKCKSMGIREGEEERERWREGEDLRKHKAFCEA